MENEWSPPTVEVDIDGVKTIKPLECSKWTSDHKNLRACDPKALNAITCALSQDELKRIMTCTTAKQAWDILETTYERTSIVRGPKLQMLTTEFEINVWKKMKRLHNSIQN